MAKTARLELRIEPELLARIDDARGDVKRATFVERALEAHLDGRVAARSPGNPAAEKAKREAPPDRRVKSSAEAKASARGIPEAGKR